MTGNRNNKVNKDIKYRNLQEQYENLANAVILRAVEDYRQTEREENLLEIDRFFRSDWFSVLTKVNPEFLIEKLRKEKQQNGY